MPEDRTPDLEDNVLDVLPGIDGRLGDALVINLFGGPGTGKSTAAAGIFHAMKQHGIEAACPEEHAKLALWSGQPWLLDEQVVLLGRTWETLHALRDKVDVIIVDSPVLLCSVYAQGREPKAFHQVVAHFHKRTPRINILLGRNPALQYSRNGRRESHDEARDVDRRIRDLLVGAGESFIENVDTPGLVQDLVRTARCLGY